MNYYKDEKITIRDICREDAINLFSCRIDKELNLHDPRPVPRNRKELLEECICFCSRFDDEIMNENVEERKYKYFIITDNKDNFIGFVNFFSIDNVKKQGEMGVIIADKRYFRKEIAYTAVNEVMKYIFDNMDINRIYIETGETNEPALRLFKKLGFNSCGEYIENENFKFIVMDKKKVF